MVAVLEVVLFWLRKVSLRFFIHFTSAEKRLVGLGRRTTPSRPFPLACSFTPLYVRTITVSDIKTPFARSTQRLLLQQPPASKEGSSLRRWRAQSGSWDAFSGFRSSRQFRLLFRRTRRGLRQRSKQGHQRCGFQGCVAQLRSLQLKVVRAAFSRLDIC